MKSDPLEDQPRCHFLYGKPLYEDSERDTLLNPKVIIEVLSPSTEAHDRGKKFESYRTIPSLEEYVLVSKDRPKIVRFRRQNAIWVLQESCSEDDAITLASVNARLMLKEIYRNLCGVPDYVDQDPVFPWG